MATLDELRKEMGLEPLNSSVNASSTAGSGAAVSQGTNTLAGLREQLGLAPLETKTPASNASSINASTNTTNISTSKNVNSNVYFRWNSTAEAEEDLNNQANVLNGIYDIISNTNVDDLDANGIVNYNNMVDDYTAKQSQFNADYDTYKTVMNNRDQVAQAINLRDAGITTGKIEDNESGLQAVKNNTSAYALEQSDTSAHYANAAADAKRKADDYLNQYNVLTTEGDTEAANKAYQSYQEQMKRYNSLNEHSAELTQKANAMRSNAAEDSDVQKYYSNVQNTNYYNLLKTMNDKFFANGNVDYNNRRNFVSAEAMHEAGWTDFDDNDIATIYTDTRTEGEEGNLFTVEFTPIVNSNTGEILSPEELREYEDSLDYSSMDALLKSDTKKLIVNAQAGDYDENYWNNYYAELEPYKQQQAAMWQSMQANGTSATSENEPKGIAYEDTERAESIPLITNSKIADAQDKVSKLQMQLNGMDMSNPLYWTISNELNNAQSALTELQSVSNPNGVKAEDVPTNVLTYYYDLYETNPSEAIRFLSDWSQNNYDPTTLDAALAGFSQGMGFTSIASGINKLTGNEETTINGMPNVYAAEAKNEMASSIGSLAGTLVNFGMLKGLGSGAVAGKAGSAVTKLLSTKMPATIANVAGKAVTSGIEFGLQDLAVNAGYLAAGSQYNMNSEGQINTEKYGITDYLKDAGKSTISGAVMGIASEAANSASIKFLSKYPNLWTPFTEFVRGTTAGTVAGASLAGTSYLLADNDEKPTASEIWEQIAFAFILSAYGSYSAAKTTSSKFKDLFSTSKEHLEKAIKTYENFDSYKAWMESRGKDTSNITIEQYETEKAKAAQNNLEIIQQSKKTVEDFVKDNGSYIPGAGKEYTELMELLDGLEAHYSSEASGKTSGAGTNYTVSYEDYYGQREITDSSEGPTEQQTSELAKAYEDGINKGLENAEKAKPETEARIPEATEPEGLSLPTLETENTESVIANGNNGQNPGRAEAQRNTEAISAVNNIADNQQNRGTISDISAAEPGTNTERAPAESRNNDLTESSKRTNNAENTLKLPEVESNDIRRVEEKQGTYNLRRPGDWGTDGRMDRQGETEAEESGAGRAVSQPAKSNPYLAASTEYRENVVKPMTDAAEKAGNHVSYSELLTGKRAEGENATALLIPDEALSDECREIRRRAIEEDGHAGVTFIAGMLELPTGQKVRSFEDPDTGEMFISVDSTKATATQYYEHEDSHTKASPEIIRTFRDAVRAKDPNGAKLAEIAIRGKYDAQLKGLTADAQLDYIWDEILANAKAGMNAYGTKMSKYQNEANKAFSGTLTDNTKKTLEGNAPREEITATGTSKRAPPAGSTASKSNVKFSLGSANTINTQLAEKFKNGTLSYTDVEDSAKDFALDKLAGKDKDHPAKSIYNTLMSEGYFNANGITVAKTPAGMYVETNQSGINEAFNKNAYFEQLSKDLQNKKLLCIRIMPQLLENSELLADDVPYNEETHDKKATNKYAYYKSILKIEDASGNIQDYYVVLTVRKSIRKNMFWIHSIFSSEKDMLASLNRSMPTGMGRKRVSSQQYAVIIAKESETVKSNQWAKIKSTNNLKPGTYAVSSKEELKTLPEVIDEWEPGRNYAPDYTWDDAATDLQSGKIDAYTNSYLKNGSTIYTSKSQLQSVFPNGKIHKFTISANNVAWTSPLEGKYVEIEDNPPKHSAPRFAMEDDVEEKNNLVALHNLSESKLLKVLKLEGFPMPSIAVTRDDISHTNYGDITVLFGPNTINPESNKANKVYGSDAWTPTTPSVEYPVDGDKMQQFDSKIDELSSKVADGMFKGSDPLGSTISRETSEQTAEELAERLAGRENVKAAYLADKGEALEPVMKTEAPSYHKFGNDTLKSIIDNIGEDEFLDFYYANDFKPVSFIDDDMLQRVKDAAIKHFNSSTNSAGRPRGFLIKVVNSYDGYKGAKLLNAAFELYRNGDAEETKVDKLATSNMLSEKAPEKDVAKWLLPQLEDMFGEPGIRNRTEAFTPSGRYKSFNQLHDSYTADNIVKNMLQKQNQRGQGLNNISIGATSLQAVSSPSYKNIASMHKDAWKLGKVSEESYSKAVSDVDNQINEIFDLIAKDNGTNRWLINDGITDSWLKVAQKSPSVDSIITSFKRNDITITKETAQKILKTTAAAAQLPTEYFEAKPERVVGFDEIISAIIPDTSSQKLKDALTEKGISYKEYKSGNDDDRMKVLNEIADNNPNVRFAMEDDALIGDEDETYTNDNQPVEFTWAVVPLEDLVVSNDETGAINPNYPAELQPRDRTRQSSQTQINTIANNINPRRLADSASISEGAPIVRPDGVVVAGNGRTAGIAKAYKEGKAEAYSSFIEQRASRYGIEGELPDNPVLVRIATNVNDWAELGRQSNESSVSAYSSTEQAMTDAEKMSDDIIGLLRADDNGNLNTAANQDFISAFVSQVVPTSEQGSVITSNGLLSKDGLSRIEYAVFAKAYGDPELLARFSENLDDDKRNISKGLLAAAPAVVQTTREIEAGNLYDIPMKDTIIEGVKAYTEAKKGRKTVDELANQGTLNEETYSPEGLFMARVLEASARSYAQVRDFIQAYADTIESYGSPDQIGLFGDNEYSNQTALEGAAKQYEQETGRTLPAPDGWNTQSVWTEYENEELQRIQEEANRRAEEAAAAAEQNSSDDSSSKNLEEVSEPVSEPTIQTTPERDESIDSFLNEMAQLTDDYTSTARQQPAEQNTAKKQNIPQSTAEFNEQKAQAAMEEYLKPRAKEDFDGTASLRKIGVAVDNSVGLYDKTESLISNARSRKSVERETKAAEKRLKPTDKEIVFAEQLAAGNIGAEDIPETVDVDKVIELSDYYEARNAVKSKSLQNVRRDINDREQARLRDLFKGAEADELVGNTWKVPNMLMLNERTPQRNMLNIFGEKLGKKVNAHLFDPVFHNEASRYRWCENMYDKVRKFEGSNGKKSKLSKIESATVQMVIEGKAASEAVGALEMGKSIKNAAENYRKRIKEAGGDKVERQTAIDILTEEARAFSIDKSQRDLVVQYARWLEAEDLLKSDKVDAVKVNNAAKTYSEIFNDLYDAINDFLVAHGYEPIGFIKGYAPHMQTEDNINVFNKALQRMGLNNDVTTLPTAIAGLTGTYKPNKRWNPYFLQRNTDFTNYDIQAAYQSYIEYMSDVLFHTDDIMRVRQAGKWFRANYDKDEAVHKLDWAEQVRWRDTETDKKLEWLRDNKIISPEAAPNEQTIQSLFDSSVEEVYNNIAETTKYGNLAMFFEDYADVLAGKQHQGDRSMEHLINRKSMNTFNHFASMLARSKVGGSLTSAMRQLSQIPAINAELGDYWTARAIADIVTGRIARTGFVKQSDYLTGKEGINNLVDSFGEEAMNVLFEPLHLVDMFTGIVGVRGKYLKEIAHGKSHEEAMRAADEFGKNQIGSRMKGAKPLGYSSKNPIMQMLNMFQLEAANQWEHISQDIPREYREKAEEKGKAKAAMWLANILVKMLLGSFILNRLSDELTGRTITAIDPLGYSANFLASGQGLTTNEFLLESTDNVLEKLTGERMLGTTESDTLSDGEFDWESALEDTTYNILSAFPYARNALALLGLDSSSGIISSVKDDFVDFKEALTAMLTANEGETISPEPLLWATANLASNFLPGGTQLMRTAQGVQDVVRGGNYKNYGTDNAQLKYPVSDDWATAIQTAIFGQYANEESKEYYASGTNALSAKATSAYEIAVDSGMTRQEAYDAMLSFREIDNDDDTPSYIKNAQERALLNELPISDEAKLDMYAELLPANYTYPEKMQSLMDTGMSFGEAAEVYDKYQEIDNTDVNATRKDTLFVNWLDSNGYSNKVKDAVTETLGYWGMVKADATTYNKLTDGAGLSGQKALDLQEDLSELTPLTGKTNVTDSQKVQCIANSSYLSDQEKADAIGEITNSDTQKKKVILAANAGLSIAAYADFCVNMWEYDSPNDDGETGSMSQSDYKDAIDALYPLYSDELKGALWEIVTSGGALKNNPYSRSSTINDIRTALKDSSYMPTLSGYNSGVSLPSLNYSSASTTSNNSSENISLPSLD